MEDGRDPIDRCNSVSFVHSLNQDFDFHLFFHLFCVFDSFFLSMKEFVIMVSHEIHHYWLFLLVLQLKLKFLCYDIIYTSNKLDMNLIKNKSTNSGVFLYS